MTRKIEFIGGPHDGEIRAINGTLPPYFYFFVKGRNFESYLPQDKDTIEGVRIRRAEYELVREKTKFMNLLLRARYVYKFVGIE